MVGKTAFLFAALTCFLERPEVNLLLFYIVLTGGEMRWSFVGVELSFAVPHHFTVYHTNIGMFFLFFF